MWLRHLRNWLGRQVPSRNARRRHGKGAILRLEMLEDRTVPTAITWTGAAGTSLWNTPGNWNLSRVPTAGDDVGVPSGTSTTLITLSGAAANIDSLTSVVPIVVNGTTLTTTGGGTPSTGGVTINSSATLTIQAGGTLAIVSNNQTLGGDGTGKVVFGDTNPVNTITVAAGLTLDVDAGFTIDGQTGVIGGAGTLVNDGTIRADTNGNLIAIQTGHAVANTNGVLQATNGATLALQAGVTGGTIATDANSASKVTQNAVTISSAAISGRLVPSGSQSNQLSAATISGTGIIDLSSGDERIGDGLTLDGTINITGAARSVSAWRRTNRSRSIAPALRRPATSSSMATPATACRSTAAWS
jgi:hypothetical protein